MATEDHKTLADIIKGVHNELRLQFQSCKDDDGADDLWDKHCKRLDVLANYSSAMHCLANVHWAKNNSSTRIDWCYSTIMDYFTNGGMEKALKKDVRLRAMCRNDIDKFNKTDVKVRADAKIKLLDVGSCYNPFSGYENLTTLAVDIYPATPNVHKCDFLKLEVVPQPEDNTSTLANELSSPITALPEKSYHVVVFSLLLEYLPSKHQRLLCCQKGARLLMENGLLLIITPDSKHQNHNAKMMKSWKLTLESLGLWRIKYEKQMHIHCLAFRKGPEDLKPQLQSGSLSDCKGLYIPQDFRPISKPSSQAEAIPIDAEDVKWTFLDLPDSSCLD